MGSKAMVMAAFVADMLALGVHWIYEVEKIRAIGDPVDQPLAPGPTSLHRSRSRGDFTHYGDQSLLLLRSLVRHAGFSLPRFCQDWQALFTQYPGYIDQATAATLSWLQQGGSPGQGGSRSTDLGGPARISPLIAFYRDDLDPLLTAVRQQTMLTHNSSACLAGSCFLARAGFAILHGQTIDDALNTALEQGIDDIDLDGRIRMALEVPPGNTLQTIARIGQACSITMALPAALHLVRTYPDNLRQALIDNVMAGGDSAARGLVVGMLIGASQGMGCIDPAWLNAMNQKAEIETLLEQLF
jgi:ADP-ribosylglycohydrolase